MDDKPVHNWSVSAEMLPKNEKTEEIYKQRALVEAAEAEKAAQAKAAADKNKAAAKQKAKAQGDAAALKMEQERIKLQTLKRQEEESKKLGGRMINMLRKLQQDQTPRDFDFTGIDLGSVRLRILVTNMVNNTTLRACSLTRKLIEEEEGVYLAQMLMVNKNIRKLELEGNKLGPRTAREFSHVIKVNKNLQFLDLENNSLTTDGDDPTGLLSFITSLKTNESLLSLNVANNRLDETIGKAFEECLSVNRSLIDFEFGFNHFTVETTRNIQAFLRRNKAEYDKNRLMEWKERLFMRDEDAQLANKYLREATKKEADRMEEDAFEQKQKEIQEEWRKKKLDMELVRQQLIQQLTEASIIRGSKGKRKGKRGGGKKKKGM